MGVVANLVVRVTAATGEFNKQIATLERSFDRTGSKLQSIGSKLTAGVTLPIVGAGLAAVKFAADFEKSTTKLVTLSGVSETQMKKMRQAVLDLAPTVGIGPKALADALLVVTSTGFEGARALQILELSAKSSAIGMGDTKDVARALTSAVSAYGVENLSAAQAADILHATVVAGGAEASELAGELGRVVGVAASLGVSFQETGAFIATYTRLGLSAAEATTGLSGVLNTILNPSQEARKALAGLGLSAEDLRAQVAEQGLGAALTGLIAKLHGNHDATGALFGNVRALAGVMGTAGSQAAAYRENLDKITNSAGSLNRAFEETKKTFAFQWDQFRAQAERTAIALGVQLLPAMMRIMEAARPVLEMVVALIDGFSRLPQPIQTGVIAFFGLAAAIGPIAYLIGNVMRAVSGLAGAWTLATKGMSGFSLSFTNLAIAVSRASLVLGSFWAGWSVGRALDLKVTINGMSPSEWTTALWNFGMGLKGISWEDAKLGAMGHRAGETFNSRPGAGAKGGDTHLGPEAPGVGLPGFGGGSGAPSVPVRPNQFGGTDVFRAAREAMADMQQIGGLTKLTADELQRLNTTLEGALEKYAALGRVAPAAMLETYVRTLQLNAITGVGNIAGQLPGAQNLSDLTALPIAPPPGIGPVTTGIDNIAGMLPGATALPGMPQLPGFFGSIFGGSKNFGADLSGTIMQALTGGGSVGGSVGGLLGGKLFGGLAGKLTGKLAGSGLSGMLGGALGSIIPGLGTMIGSMVGPLIGKLFSKFGNAGRDVVKDFAKDHGGFDALHEKLGAMGSKGEELWIKLTQGVGRNNPEQAKKAIEEVGAALENWPEIKSQAISDVVSGVNARSQNLTSQDDFNVVSAGAMAGFGLQIQNGASAIEAFQGISGAVTAMRDAMAGNNFAMTESATRLFELGGFLDANAVQFQNIAASGQIMSAMLKGNIADTGLMSVVAADLGNQLQMVINQGVPVAQALALAQPQLQALWEAQQQFGFATDETTQALIDQAVQQGIVGANMRDVNQKILDVLIHIGDALGAQIPAALRGLPAVAQEAANGMNHAFSGVQLPDLNVAVPDGWQTLQPVSSGGGEYDVPQMAKGGIVRARSGGTLVNVGEAGSDEAIVPLGSSSGLPGMGGSMTVIIEQDGRQAAEFIVPYIPDAVRRYGLV